MRFVETTGEEGNGKENQSKESTKNYEKNNADATAEINLQKSLRVKKEKSQFRGKSLAHHYRHLTFGFGSVRCPGRHIAIGETKLIVIYLLKNYNIEHLSKNTDPGMDLTHIGFGVMPPKNVINVSISPRSTKLC